jgi:hypothetical protein
MDNISASPIQPKPYRTYSYGGLAFAMVATPTDAIVIAGAARSLVRVKRVAISGAATAAGTMPVQLVKRSSAGTLGSAVLTAVTPARHDSEFPAPHCAVSTVGTANYTTVGTAAGVVRAARLCMTALGTGVGVVPVVWDFSTRFDHPVILRGTGELLCVNFNGAAIPAGGVIDYEIELEEVLLNYTVAA